MVFGEIGNFYLAKKFKTMKKKIKFNTYPKNYKTIHIKKEVYEELLKIYDFGNVGNQEKIKQLLRFYKMKK